MALKTLMLRKKIDDATKALEALRAKDAEFATREAELATSIEEAQTDEEKAVVEAEVEKFESERTAHENEKSELERTCNELETELADAEKEAPAPAAEPIPVDNADGVERERNITMNTRTQFFGMNAQERDAFLRDDEVKGFLERCRGFIKEERSVSGTELTIPTIMLNTIRQNIEDYSKLLRKVNKKALKGKARQNIMGTLPEAIWMEMCATLNELSFGFNNVEVDGYKVGGFIPICNATLEDSDENLAREIMIAIGQAIGLALDKAIVFGTNVKMPMGIFTRLKQTAVPEDYPTTYRPWVDLHTSNIITVANTVHGVELFQQLLFDASKAKGKYSKGDKTWVMNEATHNRLKAEALSINAAGAIVTGISNTLPVIGGEIIELEFMPDDMIVGGFLDLYLLVERAGMKFAKSTDYKFVEDVTVFKGTARYDGEPVIAEGFVAIGLNGVTPSDSGISFPEDVANPN